MLSLEEQIQDAVELLQQAYRIVALTGAGISTESGIPDFRSPGSIWQQLPPVNYRDFINKPEARRQYWQTRKSLAGQVAAARPNAAHRALTTLEQKQRLLGVITQNFDGLHQEAGQQPERVVELHGTSRLAACTLCGNRSSMVQLQQRVDAGEQDPQCPICGGYLKAATILFGQRVPDTELNRAKVLTSQCDLFLVIGSSLKVVPASTLPRLALRRNIPLIIINHTPTSLDTVADVAIHASAGDILPTLVAQL
ncbi:SIR2 family NAD-dependent protein deacylase [Dictyobacter kobayashii]|uniref:protein acetyllysine N-acetyltransferase n=1 Tax=Dictyobacter kobayashii TaxID=2014872 RepID=A0A402ABX4_9CHLR|nr:Sir2 family NAD-dependent protein deacetylase [Dictyobacter kobayashii]GCE16596.1 NAD-dependent protein deacetylase [Dictyobacter kobayashii]